MSSLDFIIDKITFSYSALNTYATCPYSYKLTYIDKCPRIENFYGQYGTLLHEVMYQYFSNQLDAFELSQYFRDKYEEYVNAYPPAYPAGMEERYIEEGLEFLDNFYFDMKKYKALLNEEKIEFDIDDLAQFVAKPDLVLFEEDTGKFLMYDYKTSMPFKTDKRTGKERVDNKKIESYYKQMYIYAYALRNYKFIPIDEIRIWFLRAGREVTLVWKKEEEETTMKWVRRTIKKIKKDEKFMYDNTNVYFCNNLCSVRESCEFKLAMGGT